MPRRSIRAWSLALALVVCLQLGATSADAATSVVLTPAADALVHELNKTTPYGTSSSLSAYGSPNVESYLRFTLPIAPAGQVLTGATLRVRTTNISSAGSTNTQQVRQAQDTWAEASVTWETKPAVFGNVLGGLANPNSIATGYDIALSPTEMSALLGTTVSLAVLGTGTDSFWFTSREWGSAAERPSLTLTFDSSGDNTAPTTPTNLATSVNGSSVGLSWTASTDNVGVTSYDVHRSGTSGFVPDPTTLIGAVATPNFTNSAVPAGSWHYRIVARDATGNRSPASTQASAVVAANGDSERPSAPAGLTSSVSGSSVTLSWTASSDNVGVAGYDVHRSSVDGFSPEPGTFLASVAATTFTNTSVPAGTWHYLVVAKDAAGNVSAPSGQAVAVVSPAPAATTTTLSPTADAYVHQRDKASNYGMSTTLSVSGSPQVQSFLRFGLPAPAGQSLVDATLRVTTTSDASAGSANVQQVRQAQNNWTESTIAWNTRPSVSAAVLGSLSAPTAISTGYSLSLDPAAVSSLLGTTFSLAVLGTGKDNFLFASRESATAAKRPTLVLRFASAGDSVAPTAPADLTVTPGGSTSVALSWTASTDDVGVVGYQVHRSANSGFSPGGATLITTTSANSYTDPARPAGTAYYRVIATDAAGNLSAPSNEATAVVTSPNEVTVLAVGDLACAPGSTITSTACRHRDVASAVNAFPGATLVPLGDLQYRSGTYAEFVGSGAYDTAFGPFKARTLPVPGNHEILDPAGHNQGYFDYFYGAGVNQGPFGDRPAGYYSTTLGGWQFIALNTECAGDASNGNNMVAGGCAVGSPQYQWLESVLAASTARCTLVAFHRPRWTTGAHQPYAALGPMWDLMVRAGVDVSVAGHNHSSEIFQRIGASGSSSTPTLDPAGIRSFVAGGGGHSLYPFQDTSSASFRALQARDATTFGALRLTLKDGSFDWAFTPIAGQRFSNFNGTTGAFSGTGETCH